MSETVTTERRDEEPTDDYDAASESAEDVDERAAETERVDDHLDVEDGCGCAEVWEHLSEERAE
ncbi:hypothetical protein [Halococcoides cellulosivorans]|uniref:Uncharacterized protein n=1 Tax=Halococcoides cellulosivorans TaxID=1679096 RepID=A0A2R4X246_9EURY|nr:hypothetical protein [Halococcoides cellulosivorans]AWB27858.1 hypothetical protein HARCEL1_09105 [Halococcoides cellulosivorans]